MLHNLLYSHDSAKLPGVGEIGMCTNRITGRMSVGVRVFGADIFGRYLDLPTTAGLGRLMRATTAAEFEAIAWSLGAVPA